MLGWFRAQASRIAVAAIMSLGALGASLVVPHVDDCHDSACLAVAVEHDAGAHHFIAPRTSVDTHPLHCLVCHWARTFRPRTEASVLLAPLVDAGIPVLVEPETISAVTAATLPPLRAPPATPLA